VLAPALVGNAVYAASRNGLVSRLDAGTGRVIWQTGIGATVTGGVAASDDTVVVGTNEGEVIALDANGGAVRWRARVSSEVLAAPVVAGDAVVVRCSDSRLFGLDVRDGRRRWVYQRPMPTLTVRSTAGVVVRGGTAYAGFAGGRMVAIALNNGGVRWEASVALPRGATELERVADVVGLPWVSEREACAVAYQGQLTAPLPVGREIAVADLEGFVHFLARDNGDFIGRTATDGSSVAAPIVEIPGGFLVQTRRGNLYALSVQDGSKP
jgi:outer membrane protein assembly factor BamB